MVKSTTKVRTTFVEPAVPSTLPILTFFASSISIEFVKVRSSFCTYAERGNDILITLRQCLDDAFKVIDAWPRLPPSVFSLALSVCLYDPRICTRSLSCISVSSISQRGGGKRSSQLKNVTVFQLRLRYSIDHFSFQLSDFTVVLWLDPEPRLILAQFQAKVGAFPFR